MALKIFQHMQDILRKSERFTDKDENTFVHTILEAIENIDAELIKLLLGDEKAKEQFFISIEGALVLNQNKLIEFFTMNEFSKNSYTSYTNKIGLIKKESFIKKFDDVVLAWPHKDCVLEGGQRKDDEKNNEVFYNEILSRDEIDRLFEPKALTNIKRYSVRPELVEGSVDGSTSSPRTGNPACEESIPSEITMDDNLILKGNNLIALHSLKKKYAGKVKLIYIDPPYNTGNDSFKYNDKFNHSTWLTFMKNRLEVARELLRDDGVIFVSIDDNEQGYLKVMMDEVFGRNEYITTIITQNNPKGRVMDKHFSTSHEYLLVYSKNAVIKELTVKKTAEEINKNYTEKDENGKYRLLELRNTHKQFGKHNRRNLYFPLFVDITTQRVSIEKSKLYTIKVEPIWDDGFEGCWTWGINKCDIDIDVLTAKNVNGKWKIYRKSYANDSDGNFVSKKLKTIWLSKDFHTEKGQKLLNEMFGKNIFYAPKPLELIKTIIDLATDINSNDIILDFHAGSGTTAHAILDLNKEDGGNRKFILIEQMDYIEMVTCERVKKVIEKNCEGDFIYAELKQIDTFKEAEIGKLNKNMHYLPITEIEDEEYGISAEEIALNKQFYGFDNV